MTPGPGIEPGTHWWEASALTTAPSLLPLKPRQPHFEVFCRSEWQRYQDDHKNKLVTGSLTGKDLV